MGSDHRDQIHHDATGQRAIAAATSNRTSYGFYSLVLIARRYPIQFARLSEPRLHVKDGNPIMLPAIVPSVMAEAISDQVEYINKLVALKKSGATTLSDHEKNLFILCSRLEGILFRDIPGRKYISDLGEQFLITMLERDNAYQVLMGVGHQIDSYKKETESMREKNTRINELFRAKEETFSETSARHLHQMLSLVNCSRSNRFLEQVDTLHREAKAEARRVLREAYANRQAAAKTSHRKRSQRATASQTDKKHSRSTSIDRAHQTVRHEITALLAELKATADQLEKKLSSNATATTPRTVNETTASGPHNKGDQQPLLDASLDDINIHQNRSKLYEELATARNLHTLLSETCETYFSRKEHTKDSLKSFKTQTAKIIKDHSSLGKSNYFGKTFWKLSYTLARYFYSQDKIIEKSAELSTWTGKFFANVVTGGNYMHAESIIEKAAKSVTCTA